MIKNILPAYLYQQYTPDDDLQAFFDAYNEMSQTNLDTLNSLNLPNYTVQNGAMLDWVAQGIYGMVRPTLPIGGYRKYGSYDTASYDTLSYDQEKVIPPTSFYVTTDDIFKRILTWNYYQGDGTQFTIKWLKNRVQRFLQGTNGYLPVLDNTYQVSVTFAAYNVVNIAITTGILTPFAPIMQSAINGGALALPFQYTYNVTY